MRYALFVAAVLLPVGALAVGEGLVQTDGSTLETGTAPVKGKIIVDPNSYDLGPQATAWATVDEAPVMPDFVLPDPAPLGHSGNAFSAAGDLVLPGGEYEYDSYAVYNYSTVTYSGPVTIRVFGAVDLNAGSITTTADGASITIVCGTFTLADGVLETSVTTWGAGADITVTAAGSIGAYGPIEADLGTVSLNPDAAGTVQATNATLPGGTYFLMSYTVSSGATVTYTGPTVLRVFGTVDLSDGRIATTAPGASVTIVCDDLLVGAATGSPGTDTEGAVTTSGAGAGIAVTAAGGIHLELGEISAADGDIALDACSWNAGAGAPGPAEGIFVVGGAVRSQTGSIRLASAGPVRIGPEAGSGLPATYQGTVEVVDGPTALMDILSHDLGGAKHGVEIDGGSGVHLSGSDQLLRVLSSRHVRIAGGSSVSATGAAHLRIEGHGVDAEGRSVVIEGASALSAQGVYLYGYVVAGFFGDSTVSGIDGVHVLSPSIRVGDTFASGEPFGPILDEGAVLSSSSGAIRFAAAGSNGGSGLDGIHVSGSHSALVASVGSIHLDSQNLVAAGDGALLSAEQGEVVVIGDQSVYLGGTGQAAGTVTAGALRVGSSGTVNLHLSSCTTLAGGIEVSAYQGVACYGPLVSWEDIALSCETGMVEIAGASLTTADRDGAPSGTISVESFAEPGGAVAVTNSTLRTGGSDERSGDVRLRVVKPVARHLASSWIIPLEGEGHGNIADPSDIAFRVSGELNTGEAADPQYLGLRINEVDYSFTLVPGAAEGTFAHAFDGTMGLTLVRSRSGRSRFAFDMTLQGPPLAVGFDGIVVFGPGNGFADPGQDVTIQVKPGALSDSIVPVSFEPAAGVGSYLSDAYWLQKAKVTSKGTGKGSFALTISMPSAPNLKPPLDARASVGGAAFTFPAGTGKTRGSKTTWKTKEGGTVTLVLDQARKRVTLKGSKATLGTFPAGPTLVEFGVGFGTLEQNGKVIMGRKGAALVW